MPIWIDVGAHLGEHTLEAARKDPNIKVWAFEPNTILAAKLASMAPPNYHVEFSALSNFEHMAPVYCSPNDTQTSLLSYPEATHSFMVPCYELDGWIEQLGDIDWLKIDTQGNDLNVLKGAGDRLKQVKRITCEVTLRDPDPNGWPSKAEIVSYLAGYGFHISKEETWGDEQDVTFERDRNS